MSKATKIVTVGDARDQKRASDYNRFYAKMDAAAAKAEAIRATLAVNPHIGVLSRNGKAVYYVNFPQYREASTPAALI